MRKLLHIIPGSSVLLAALDVDLRLDLSCFAKVRRNTFNPQRFAGTLNGSIRESLNPMALSQRCPRLHSESMDLRPACPLSDIPSDGYVDLRATADLTTESRGTGDARSTFTTVTTAGSPRGPETLASFLDPAVAAK
jgi:hypothetical protein